MTLKHLLLTRTNFLFFFFVLLLIDVHRHLLYRHLLYLHLLNSAVLLAAAGFLQLLVMWWLAYTGDITHGTGAIVLDGSGMGGIGGALKSDGLVSSEAAAVGSLVPSPLP